MKKKLSEQQKDAFRKHFIAAAEKLFASRGVAGVTMRQIAQAWATARPRHTAISRRRTKSSQRCAPRRCIVSATGSMPRAGIATRAPMRKPSEPPTLNPDGVFEMKGLNGQHPRQPGGRSRDRKALLTPCRRHRVHARSRSAGIPVDRASRQKTVPDSRCPRAGAGCPIRPVSSPSHPRP